MKTVNQYIAQLATRLSPLDRVVALALVAGSLYGASMGLREFSTGATGVVAALAPLLAALAAAGGLGCLVSVFGELQRSLPSAPAVDAAQFAAARPPVTPPATVAALPKCSIFAQRRNAFDARHR